MHSSLCLRARKRDGFTLVELLVVIAIIGILVALLLPAVQAAREAARRMSCTNNLKQLALALHNYHDTYKTFPPGNLNCQGHPNCHPTNYNYGGPHLTTWTIAILPFMEQQPLYDEYDQTLPNEHANNRPVVQRVLESQLCPSDVNTNQLEKPESGPGSGENWAPGSYRAVSGLAVKTGGPFFDEGNSESGSNRGLLHVVYGNKWGVENMASVTDGTSNTIMVGEYHTRTHNRRRTFWGYAYTSYNESSIAIGGSDITAFGVPDYDKCASSAIPANSNSCKRAFASFHPGGVNFALADGSVRFVNKNTNAVVLAAVSTVGGGEPYSLE
jgi:prepilin-type N-terminal cleavage/methylation domain-containing protein/prepilin-type processing-associated H-X9-DG protein